MNLTWKQNWDESKKRYLDWWNGKGLVISMWEHLDKDGKPHESVTPPLPPKDINQYWFDPDWRAAYLHYRLSKSSFKADILPVANTHLGPGSLSAILGAELEGGEDTIWIKHREDFGDEIVFDEKNKWWQLHLDLLKACKRYSQGKYFVGCPDLIEGLDTLASLKGIQPVLTDMLLRPEVLKNQLQKINEIYFRVFNTVYEIIREGDEMAFCYFSIWGPAKVSKLQCDISVMISEEDFRNFALPYLREQCQKIDYTLYHLDGVDAIRHLDAVLEIEELNAVQWTPGEGEPQGGDKQWYDLYKKILAKGKSVMPCWVETHELKPLLDNVGATGLNILMHFKSERDIDEALMVADEYR
ncbi:MAG TPA: hypothetical protein VJ346_01140 [Bacteroidales bacterium]|nr:hypothetical protein [Bacteroidales bacterium]